MKTYRVSIPVLLGLDIAAESEEQAARIATAMVYTPVEPLELTSTLDNLTPAIFSGSSKGELSPCGKDCHAVYSGEFDPRIEVAQELFALENGNEAEYENAKTKH